MTRWAVLGLFSLSGLLGACDKAPAPSPAPPITSPSAAATGSDPHGEHDCSVAHPDSAPKAVAVASATKLSDEARARADTLRISAKVGSVIVRKTEQGWLLAGPHGCTVSEARMAQVFNGLGTLGAEPTDEHPADFELQIVVLHGQERLLHFDVAGQKDGRDLVQLTDASAFHIRGLDRSVLSADPRIWCARP